jgi:hypothetical protein
LEAGYAVVAKVKIMERGPMTVDGCYVSGSDVKA